MGRADLVESFFLALALRPTAELTEPVTAPPWLSDPSAGDRYPGNWNSPDSVNVLVSLRASD